MRIGRVGVPAETVVAKGHAALGESNFAVERLRGCATPLSNRIIRPEDHLLPPLAPATIERQFLTYERTVGSTLYELSNTNTGIVAFKSNLMRTCLGNLLFFSHSSDIVRTRDTVDGF